MERKTNSNTIDGKTNGAPKGAPFVFPVKYFYRFSAFSLLLLSALLLSTVAGISYSYASCKADRFDLSAKVKFVHDGDTIRLGTDEKLRLIGINTPELGHDDQKPEPYSWEAKKQLTQLLSQQGNQVDRKSTRLNSSHVA